MRSIFFGNNDVCGVVPAGYRPPRCFFIGLCNRARHVRERICEAYSLGDTTARSYPRQGFVFFEAGFTRLCRCCISLTAALTGSATACRSSSPFLEPRMCLHGRCAFSASDTVFSPNTTPDICRETQVCCREYQKESAYHRLRL